MSRLLEITPDASGSVLKLVGEIDGSNHAAMTSAIETALQLGGSVRLDLRALGFMSVRATTALVDLSRGLTDGQRLICEAPPRSLVRTLDLLPGVLPDALVVSAADRAVTV